MFQFETGEVILGALYLRGVRRNGDSPKKNWAKVLQVLRSSETNVAKAADILTDCNLWMEAAILRQPGLLSEVEDLLDKGRFITAAAPDYPIRWLSVLEASAPAALWIRGKIPDRETITVVGSRNISEESHAFAEAVGQEVVRLGFALASGGAAGCDRAAAAGAVSGSRRASLPPQVVEILPFGIDLEDGHSAGCVLSVAAPNEVFSTGTAMERNALLYAISTFSVVVESKFKEGGAWHGATSAIRRRLSSIVVRRRPGDEAAIALQGLGAHPIDQPEDLGLALKERYPVQNALFSLA